MRALLLLDSIEPDLRQEWLHKAAGIPTGCGFSVHISPLWQRQLTSALSRSLRHDVIIGCIALIPAKCLLLHTAWFEKMLNGTVRHQNMLHRFSCWETQRRTVLMNNTSILAGKLWGTGPAGGTTFTGVRIGYLQAPAISLYR